MIGSRLARSTICHPPEEQLFGLVGYSDRGRWDSATAGIRWRSTPPNALTGSLPQGSN